MPRRRLSRLGIVLLLMASAFIVGALSTRHSTVRFGASTGAWDRKEAQLHAESARLTAIIRSHRGGAAGMATGSMVWPVGRSVTSGFGWRVDPVFHVRDFHSGIDFAAADGTPIRAADGGRVIFAESAGMVYGYGNVIVIDHGDRLATLYAHQSRFAVAAGALVQRGQVIGYVGSTGFSTGPHLHFEVRVDGVPEDPKRYVR